MNIQLETIYAYTKLKIKNNLKQSSVPVVSAFIPTPTEDDYSVGYMTRTFLQKTNDINAHIIEINPKEIANARQTFYYTPVELTWRLIGTPQEIMDSNSKSVKDATSTIPNLSHYLTNTLQFAKVK